MIGFKSFASRTVLEFHPGVMSVVGPNGCGKTNIVDAVRWVLGEQRSGALRAERMESVIFNGTPKRRPLGMTEVTLIIENNKGLLPTPYTEVAITRRLFRSGESEYLINRSPVRLRDFHDMFADTGLGNNAYSIIELSMVEGIITGPSEMRRILIEEAAGVARYKSRRQAAMRRLESIREKLVRIEDIYQEVEKRYRTLKRQASRARRYQTLSEAIQLRIAIDLSHERSDILMKRQPLETRLAELEDEHEEAETTATRATSELLSLEGQELAVLEKSKRLQDSLKRIERRESQLEREQALSQQRIKFLETEAAEADQRRKDLTTKIKNAEKQAVDARDEAKDIKEQLDKVQSELEDIKARAEKITSEFEIARTNASDKRKAEAEVERQLSKSLEGLVRYEDEIRRLNERGEALKSRLDELQAKLQDTEQSIVQARKQHKEQANARGADADYDKQVTGDLTKIREDHSKALSDRARAAAELEAARTALKAHRLRVESSTSLPDKLQKIVENEVLRSVADRVECKPEHRAAIAVALGSALGALDRPSLEVSLEISDEIEENKRATLRFPVDLSTEITSVNMPDDAADCIQLSSLVENEGEFGDFLRHRLANALLVSDMESLARLTPAAIERGLNLVTPAGELLEPDGVLHIGSISPDALQVGWLSELHDLETRVSNCDAALKDADEAIKTTSEKLSDAEKTVNEAQAAKQNSDDRYHQTERLISGLESDVERLQQRRQELTSELDRVQAEKNKLPVQDESRSKSEELEATLKEAKQLLQKAEDELQAVEQRRLEIAEQRATVSTESARLSERLMAINKSAEVYKKEAESVTGELANQKARLAEGSSELQRVKQAVENITAQIELSDKEKSDVNDALDSIRNQRDQLKEKRAETTSQLNASQDRQKTALKEHSRLEAEVITLRERLREIDRRLVEDAGITPDSISDDLQDEAGAKLEELGVADLSLDKMRTRLQSIGLVNMLALDELPELEKRYKFLTDQKADLENGISVLEETIDRINHEARRIFRDSFDIINDNFQEIYRTLFEGGEACLVLQDGDPLEADIRIFATPSGKKLQPLSMLSGGEKALTAIALLFGIYKVRPSPFCILDEVDAPLDDANVNRFNRLIRQYAVETQFLIVTHNKRTMETADCLFGVTLCEDGSSKMVSVKIEGGGDNENEMAKNDA